MGSGPQRQRRRGSALQGADGAGAARAVGAAGGVTHRTHRLLQKGNNDDNNDAPIFPGPCGLQTARTPDPHGYSELAGKNFFLHSICARMPGSHSQQALGGYFLCFSKCLCPTFLGTPAEKDSGPEIPNSEMCFDRAQVLT